VNGTRWTSPEVDKLIEAAAIEADAKKRAALYHQFQKLVVEACPIVWVAEMQFTSVYSNSFDGVVVSPLGVNTSFDSAWKKA
jgi:peptide/nickel transport system substrate-binding protein